MAKSMSGSLEWEWSGKREETKRTNSIEGKTTGFQAGLIFWTPTKLLLLGEIESTVVIFNYF